jgi:hypothetical protein
MSDLKRIFQRIKCDITVFEQNPSLYKLYSSKTPDRIYFKQCIIGDKKITLTKSPYELSVILIDNEKIKDNK